MKITGVVTGQINQAIKVSYQSSSSFNSSKLKIFDLSSFFLETAIRQMATISIWSLIMLVVIFPNKSHLIRAQQPYVNNKQLDCYNTAFNSTTKGFQCNVNPTSSCQSYLTFRSSPPYYATPISISYLLGAQDSTTLLVSINNISSDVASIPPDTQVIVPVNCSCYNNQYYQHNASYTLKFATETYFRVANDTYQGLTTCQALMDQNPTGDRNLTVGLRLQVPLRCACPTSNQTSSGFNYLLTYMVTWGDSLSSIAGLFGVDLQDLLHANQLTSTSIIFPFTPILVPLTTKPTNFTPVAESPPAAAPPPQISVAPPQDSGSSTNKWIFVGVALGVAALVVIIMLGFLFWYRRSSKSHRPVPILAPIKPKTMESESPIPDSNSWSLSSDGVRYAIESLTVYKYSDLQAATGYFSKDNRIKGSVYKGNFKGDGAAIKVMKGDVSREIDILKKINHSNIIRLSGFCVHQGNTYLVYEYAENGDLSDKIQTLTWKQRVQIAHDVADALNYLHNYTSPPYIHKNLKTSNILLDANLRAKVSNFGLARSLDNEEEGGLQLTRHVIGTQGYMAPEYIENGVITPKLDVFAFGVVILELLSGKEAAAGDKNSAEEEMLTAMIKRVLEGDNVRQKFCDFIDDSLGNEYPLDLAFSLAQLAKTCVAVDINSRPPISQVRMTLSKILSSSLDWDPSLELHSTASIGSGRLTSC